MASIFRENPTRAPFFASTRTRTVTLFYNLKHALGPDRTYIRRHEMAGARGMAEKRILLVEDEPEISAFLTIALRGEGYLVDVAATASEAWTYLDAQRYALVIADWRLPDGDGSLIADSAAQLGAKTFLMSGYLFQMPGGRAEQHQTLMKPIRPSEIVAAVQQSIGAASLN
jgi:CheY-like chemotaxis protein